MPKKYITQVDNFEILILVLSFAFRFLNWMLIDNVLVRLFFGLPLLISLFKNLQIIFTTSKNLSDGIELYVQDEEMGAKFLLVNQNLEIYPNLRAEKYSCVFEASDDMYADHQYYKIKWQLGGGKIYDSARKALEIFTEIEKHGKEFNFLNNNNRWKNINVPYEINKYHYSHYLPKVTINLDMVSKANLMEFFVFPTWLLLSGHLSKLLLVPEDYRLHFQFAHATISWLLSRVENYFAKKLRIKLHSEGWRGKYPPWWGWTSIGNLRFPYLNTCIGQQIKEKYVFCPDNKLPRESKHLTDFIFECEKLFKVVKRSINETVVENKLPPKLRQTINKYKYLTEGIEDKVYIERISIQTGLKSKNQSNEGKLTPPAILLKTKKTI